MHTLHCYFKPGAGVLKWQDKQLPDPNGLLSSIIPAEAMLEMLTMHTLSSTQSTQQIQGGECKRSRGSYIKLTPV